jgi:hypothetical protein
MTELIIAALAAAFIISAVEELWRPLGKLKGPLGMVTSGGAAYLLGITSTASLVPTTLAATYVALAAVAATATAVSGLSDGRVGRALPRRVPPL